MVADENLALADMVGLSDNTLFFHLFDNPSRPVVADLEMALDKACGCLLLPGHQRNGLIVKVVAAALCRLEPGNAVGSALVFGDLLEIVRFALGFQEGDESKSLDVLAVTDEAVAEVAPVEETDDSNTEIEPEISDDPGLNEEESEDEEDY